MSLEKFKEIVNGWKNYAFPTKEIEELAEDRALICATCPLNVKGTCSSSKVGKVEKTFYYKVENQNRLEGELHFGCGCPLKSKLRSENSQCPLGKF